MVEPLDRPLSSYIHTQFVTADENSSVAEAVKILQPKNVEIILVTSSLNGGKYVGIVTDSDILEKVVMKGEDSDLVFLKSIMTSPIITLPSSSTVRQAIQLMRAHKIKHLPVTDSTTSNNDGKIIGTEECDTGRMPSTGCDNCNSIDYDWECAKKEVHVVCKAHMLLIFF